MQTIVCILLAIISMQAACEGVLLIEALHACRLSIMGIEASKNTP
jgi:hypothetical protein